MLKHLLPLAAAILSITGVSSTAFPMDYFPIKKGMEKFFSHEEHRGTEGNVIGEFRDYFEGEIELDKKSYMKVIRTFKNVPQRDSTTFYFRKSSNALYNVAADTNLSMKEYKEWPLPLTLNSTWTVTYPSGQTVEKKFESIEDIYIGENKFTRCARISYSYVDKNGRVFDSYTIFAPGIGFIKQYTRSTDGSYTLKIELTRYTVK